MLSQRRERAAGLAVCDLFDAGRFGRVEFGTGSAGVDRDLAGLRGGDAQFRQPRAQLLDVVVTTQSGQGRAELIAGVLQFAAPLIGTARRSQVGDPAAASEAAKSCCAAAYCV